MSEKELGLYKKYEVTKLSNPTKKLDCIVLEFDDELSRVGIAAFSEACRNAGFKDLADDLNRKLCVWRGGHRETQP